MNTAMKKLLFVLPLVALCACGGSKKGEAVVESVQPITATVSIVDKDASRWFHSIVWDVEANSLNTKDLAQVNRVESEAPCADSLVLYSCVRSARGQKAISGGTSVDLGTQRYYTFLQDSARTTRRVVYEVPIGSGLTLTTPWLVEYEGARKSMEHIKFYMKGDTIYTLNYPEDMGFTPEGLSFRISGDDVAEVTASYSLHYDAYVADDAYSRFEHWAFVCRLATEESPLAVTPEGTYTLPVVGALAFADSDWHAMGEMRAKAVGEWEEFTGSTMDTADYLFDFDCYKVHLHVTLKDGTVRHLMHLATALYMEP